MKNRWWTMACVAVLSVAAVDASAQGVSWGLKGGLDFGSLDTDLFEASSDAGGMFGGFLGIDLGRRVRLQPEVYWSVRRFSATGGPGPFAITARGLEVPLLVHVRFPDARATQLTVFAGPQLSAIGEVEQRAGGAAVDISDQIKDGDFGVTVGAGVERAFTAGAFVIDVRALWGTRNLAEGGAGSMKSRAIQLLAGYRF